MKNIHFWCLYWLSSQCSFADWTLWPFHVDSNVNPPFTKLPCVKWKSLLNKIPNTLCSNFFFRNGDVVDTRKRKIEHFPEVPAILERLVSEGYKVGVASRTGEIKGAEQLLELFDWNKYFSFKEIYPGCKKTHFSKYDSTSCNYCPCAIYLRVI